MRDRDHGLVSEKVTETYRREGCICTGEWPKLSAPVTITEPARNRAERRARERLRTTYRSHIHSPECQARWLAAGEERESA